MGVTAESAQLNIRIPRSLKERGDATLSMMGSTPTKIIRSLWERLAEGPQSYEKVQSLLSERTSAGEEAIARRLALVNSSSTLFEELGATLGIADTPYSPYTDNEKDLLEHLEWESLQERGLA